ncbi:MAG TPA: PAS domain S-box protein [Pyrinomonadaceae bacterium]|nr:PAS domain S-box protein [Pyrinomonadaceae bacterium]
MKRTPSIAVHPSLSDEQVRFEEIVKTNEALLRLFIKHTPAAIAMFDTDMRYLQVSDRFLTDYDLEGQDLIGRSHYEVFPDLPMRWREAHRRILAGAVERCDEDSYIAADGSMGWLQWESLPWRRVDGEIGGLILFTQVITARKRAEEALRDSEERFAKIFHLSPFRMGILRIRDGVVVEVNDTWVRETGISRAEVINQSIFNFSSLMEASLVEKIRQLLKTPKPVQNLEVRFNSKTGREVIANTSAVMFELDGEPCYLWVANDITERKHAEEALRALSARIRSTREEEGTRIAREIHDELGGILTGLKWDLEKIDNTLNSSVAASDLPALRERIRSMTSLMETTINTVRRIASELRPSVLDDLGLVAAIEWQIEQFQLRSGLKCHWTNNASEIELSRERATAVFRILQEILTNVLRHARAANLYVKLRRSKHYFELEVKDDGVGITESQRMNTQSLGLLGMKERALLVGGEVRITGKEGGGTTVVVRVPLGA